MVEQSFTRTILGQLSAWTALATASLFAFGYAYQDGKLSRLGIADTSWLSTGDIFGAVRESALGIALFGGFWVLVLAMLAQGFLPSDAKRIGPEVFLNEGPVETATAAAAKKLADVGGRTGCLSLGLVGLGALVMHFLGMNVQNGSLVQGIAFAFFALMFLFMIAAAWLELTVHFKPRLFRILLSLAAAATTLAMFGNLAGTYAAAKILNGPAADIEVRLENGERVQGVLADSLSEGYLVRTRDARRIILLEHASVRQVDFLRAPSEE